MMKCVHDGATCAEIPICPECGEGYISDAAAPAWDALCRANRERVIGPQPDLSFTRVAKRHHKTPTVEGIESALRWAWEMGLGRREHEQLRRADALAWSKEGEPEPEDGILAASPLHAPGCIAPAWCEASSPEPCIGGPPSTVGDPHDVPLQICGEGNVDKTTCILAKRHDGAHYDGIGYWAGRPSDRERA